MLKTQLRRNRHIENMGYSIIEDTWHYLFNKSMLLNKTNQNQAEEKEIKH